MGGVEMKRTMLFLLLSLAAFGSIRSFRLGEVSSEESVLDGKLTEAHWTKALELPPMNVMRVREGDEYPGTRVRLAQDAKGLLVGIECEEPNMRGLVVKRLEHDTHVWQDDCVELFFNPAGDRESWVQIIVNPAGVVQDGIRDFGGAIDWGWESGIEAGVWKGRDRWVLEARVPFDALPLGPPGCDWTFHIARERRAGGDVQLFTSLASTIAGFHEVDKFDVLSGIVASGCRVHLVSSDFGECLAGLNEASFVLRNYDSSSLPAEVVMRLGDRTWRVDGSIAGGGESTLRLPWELGLEHGGMDVAVEIMISGRVYRRLLRKLDAIPGYMSPLPRLCYYLSMDEATVVRFPVNVSSRSLGSLRLRWWLWELESGRQVSSGFTRVAGPEALLRLYWTFPRSGRYHLLRRLERDGVQVAEHRDELLLLRGPY
jgi:hypothetical protein